MPRLSKLLEKLEDRIANKWGRWYERNKARAPLYAVLGGIGWYLYGMFLNSLKLGKESVFNTTGEVIESIWVFNPFKNLFAVFTPFGLGVTAFIALMVCLITKKGYSWFSGYKFTRDARGFDILPDGTHGTSGFATKKELAEHLELGSAEEVTGMLLGRIKARPDDPEKYATYVAHRMKPGENNNILCIGAPGSYKSRGFIIPFLMGCAQRSSGGHHESVVVTDPKGELFENLAPYFREHGFYVKAVNFLDMAHSDGWNCLAGLEANPDLVTTVANTIIQKGGVKIGFFGLETPEAQTKANPKLIEGLKFLAGKDGKELYACADAQVKALKEQGADLVVCLAHLGVDESSEPYTSYDLAANVEGIDFIIDGHSHSVITAGPNGEAIQSTGTAFANIGVITIDNATKQIVGNELKAIWHTEKNADGKDVTVVDYQTRDEKVAAAAKAIIDPIDKAYGEKFAVSKVHAQRREGPQRQP